MDLKPWLYHRVRYRVRFSDGNAILARVYSHRSFHGSRNHFWTSFQIISFDFNSIDVTGCFNAHFTMCYAILKWISWSFSPSTSILNWIHLCSATQPSNCASSCTEWYLYMGSFLVESFAEECSLNRQLFYQWQYGNVRRCLWVYMFLSLGRFHLAITSVCKWYPLQFTDGSSCSARIITLIVISWIINFTSAALFGLVTSIVHFGNNVWFHQQFH